MYVCAYLHVCIYIFAANTKPSVFSCIFVLCYEISHFNSVAFSLFACLEIKYNAFFEECVLFEKLISHNFSYLLTPWCRALLEKLTGLQLVKKFSEFHGTRRYITALTSVRHLSLSWTSPIQSIYPHPTSWRSILILSTHLCLGLPSGLLPSSFPTKTLYTPPHSSPICATFPAHLILLEFITCTILGEVYKSFISSLCNLLHSS